MRYDAQCVGWNKTAVLWWFCSDSNRGIMDYEPSPLAAEVQNHKAQPELHWGRLHYGAAFTSRGLYMFTPAKGRGRFERPSVGERISQLAACRPVSPAQGREGFPYFFSLERIFKALRARKLPFVGFPCNVEITYPKLVNV